jgi:hypothetical protein
VRRILCLGFTVVIAVGLTACSSSIDSSQSATFEGSGTLSTTANVDTTHTQFPKGNGCVQAAGYSDIRAGTKVVVSNSNGGTIAVGRLQRPVLGHMYANHVCVYLFTIDNIPETSDLFYGVHVGGLDRPNPIYSKSQLGSGIQIAF